MCRITHPRMHVRMNTQTTSCVCKSIKKSTDVLYDSKDFFWKIHIQIISPHVHTSASEETVDTNKYPHTHIHTHIHVHMHTHLCVYAWCYGVASVSRIDKIIGFAKEPYKRDNILQKRPIILSILLTVATPYQCLLSLFLLRCRHSQPQQTLIAPHVHTLTHTHTHSPRQAGYTVQTSSAKGAFACKSQARPILCLDSRLHS